MHTSAAKGQPVSLVHGIPPGCGNSPLKETRPVPPPGLWRFQWGRGPRHRPAASAAGRPAGPADIYVLRRLRPPLRRFPASYTRCRHPSFPRRWREPPRPIRCVQTARPSVTISSQPFCPVLPPGCLRARLGSLRLVASWVIGACRSRGRKTARIRRILRDDIFDRR